MSFESLFVSNRHKITANACELDHPFFFIYVAQVEHSAERGKEELK